MIQRQPNDGLHVMIEGIDGSGKSTVLNACRAWAEERGTVFFDVVAFSEREGRLPSVDEVGDATGLITAEPTFCWTGKAIREEIIAKHIFSRQSTVDSRPTEDAIPDGKQPKHMPWTGSCFSGAS